MKNKYIEKQRETVEKRLSNSFKICNELCNLLEFDYATGSLLDYFIFYNYDEYRVAGILRKYLIFIPERLNCYQSEYKIIFTDDDGIANYYQDLFDEWSLEYEE